MRTSVLMATLGEPGWDRFVPDLLAQTRPADEIIVVIDRPTGSPEQSALRAAYPQLRFLFNETNLGLTASLNRGLHAATGDIVFRTDDDDRSASERFARQLELFAAGGADVVTTWAEGVRDLPGAEPWLIRQPTSDAAIRQALLGRNILVHASLAFRRDRVLALGGYDETFRHAQDYALYLAAIRAGLRFAAVPEPLVRRVYPETSITVARRYHQLMYSCAARLVHAAHSGDRGDFLRVVARYALLAATPAWLRRWRRALFQRLGRGA